MAKEIVCPYCKKGLPNNNLEYDEDLNLLCNYCRGVIFAATKELENKVKHLLQATQSSSYYKKECYPIRMQNSPIVLDNSTTSPSHYGYEAFAD